MTEEGATNSGHTNERNLSDQQNTPPSSEDDDQLLQCGQRLDSQASLPLSLDDSFVLTNPIYQDTVVKSSRFQYCNDKMGQNLLVRSASVSGDSTAKAIKDTILKLGKGLTDRLDHLNHMKDGGHSPKPPISPNTRIERGKVQNLTNLYGGHSEEKPSEKQTDKQTAKRPYQEKEEMRKKCDQKVTPPKTDGGQINISDTEMDSSYTQAPP